MNKKSSSLCAAEKLSNHVLHTLLLLELRYLPYLTPFMVFEPSFAKKGGKRLRDRHSVTKLFAKVRVKKVW
jgi:hypothetical protein